MKKTFTLLFALLCASAMGWAYTTEPDTWIGTTDATYANQFKWSVLDGVATPNDVVNIQQPGFATAIGIYMNFADAGFDGVYMNGTLTTNGTEYKQDGAGIVVYLSALTAQNTEVLIKQGTTTRFGLNIYNDKGSGGSTPDPDPSPDPTPDPNDYTAGGHTIHLDASYVDIDGTNKTYTLVITSTDNMEGLGGSFWNVNGVGADMRTNAGTSSYIVSGDKKTITCQVQSNSAPNIYTPLYVLMPGEINFGSVTLNWEDRTPITSEYCNYQGSNTQQDGHYFAITWETNPSGNVVITIGNGTGAGACSYRNGGFEGDNNGLARFVVSDDDFATTTPASDYFTVTRPSDGDLEYVLTKIADLPANAKIKHLTSGAIAWKEAGVDRWCFPEFIYTYGGTCNQLDAPTNVAIDGTNHITFDAVSGAESYTASVSLGGIQKYSQVVASGDELTFVPLETGDYIVNVVASGSGKVDSDPSADVVWHLEAAPVVLGNSEYCEHVMQASTNTEAAFTWETDGSGNIVITISETLGGAANATHFRGNALALANFKVGAGQTAGSNYFSHPGTTTGNQLVLTATTAPALGEKIYYHGVVEYATSKDGNAWPTLDFEWTYGTECSGIAVSAVSNDNTMGTAVVQKAGVDVTTVESGDEVTFIATVADTEVYRFVNWTKGGVEVSTNATYVATITETTNLIANFEYIKYTYCHAEINSVQNKKLFLTLGSIGGGKYQIKIEGSAEAPLTGLNNANYTINWVTTDIVDGDKKMSGQDVPFNNARWAFDASGYGSATATFGIAEGHTWEDIYVWNHAIYFSTAAGEVGYTGFPSRYNIAWDATCADAEAPIFTKAEAEILNESSVRLKIQATDNWEGILTYTIARAGAEPIISNHASGEEFSQDVTGLTTGTEYDFTVTVSDGVNNANTHILVTPVGDETKPVMGEASLDSKTWNRAIINVAATDNKGVTAYYVVEKDADYVASEGKITVEGLTATTEYTLHIKAKDAAGNISDNQAEVSFTTDAHSLVPTTAAPVPTWPASQVKSIYSDTYELAPAHTPNYNAPWWNAPAINLSDIDGDHFMDYNLANEGMIGWQYDQISVATMEKLHIDIYASAAGTVSVRPITDGDGTLNDNRKSLTLVAQQWNSFDIDLTEFGAHDWTKLFQFSIEYWAAGGLLGEHISVDNVYLYRTTPYVDPTAPTNVSASVASESYYSVKISASAEDNSGAVNFSVMNGDTEVATGASTSGVATTITVNNLTPGTAYNFNVIAKDDADNAADPVAVAATTKTLPEPAPTPDLTCKTVVPVFSDAIPGSLAGGTQIHSGGWGESTIAQWINLTPSDKVFYAQNFNWAGWHSWGASLDATGMRFLHVDFYSLGMTQISVTPISPGHEGVYNVALTPNAWTSAEIPLSAFDANNIDWADIFQFKFMNPVGGNEFMVDNVYFYEVPDYFRADLTVGGIGTICLPYDVTAEDRQGGTFYRADYQGPGFVYFLEETGTLNAGQAYIFVAEEEAIRLWYSGSEVLTPLDGAEARGFYGTFADMAAGSLTDKYVIANGKLRLCGTGATLGANRAYLDLQDVPTTPLVVNDPANAPVRRRLGVGGNNGAATDLENVFQLNAEGTQKLILNGQLYILRDGHLYNAQGQVIK